LYSCAFDGAMHAIETMHASEAELTAPVLSNDLDTRVMPLLNAPSMVENWMSMFQGNINIRILAQIGFAKG
jgi:hypothetical protein